MFCLATTTYTHIMTLRICIITDMSRAGSVLDEGRGEKQRGQDGASGNTILWKPKQFTKSIYINIYMYTYIHVYGWIDK